MRWHEALFAYRFSDLAAMNTADSGPFMPKNVVINPFFDWGATGRRAPLTTRP